MVKEKENILSFPKILLDSLICQKCLSDLEFRNLVSDENLVYSGVLVCKQCGVLYNIKDGIVYLLDNQEIGSDIIKSEITERDKQADRYDSRMKIRYEREVIPTLEYLGDIQEKNIIEYGCGTGRITLELQEMAKYVLAIDFSLNSLKVLQEKINSKGVGLVLADAIQIKTKNDYFDIAFSAQFIEHIPNFNLRKQFYANVYNTLKLDGEFSSSLYHHDLRRAINGSPKEGMHSDKIYFYFYTAGEIKKEVNKFFKVENIKLFDITLPLVTRLGISDKLNTTISRLCEKIFPLNLFGHLVYFKASKQSDKNIFANTTNYSYSNFLFSKYWFWFARPTNISNIDVLNFFSYENYKADDFKKKKGVTTIVDLTESLEEIWKNMRKSYIRKQIDRGERNGIVVKLDNNFTEFEKVYKNFRQNKNLPKENYEVIKENGILFSGYYKDRLIAGGVFIIDIDKKFARAWVLSSLRMDEGEVDREIIGQANRMVIWEAIKYFKKNNFLKFDLGGLDHNKGETVKSSLNEFKEAYGGVRQECYFYYRINSKIINFVRKLKN